VLIPGTGLLDDFGLRPHQVPYDLLRWSVAAAAVRTPIAYVSVGAGPIVRPSNRRLMTWAARLSSYRSFRDARSRAFMAALFRQCMTDAVKPDVVFAIDRPAPATRAAEPMTVGLGLMSYYGWANDPETGQPMFRRYITTMAALAQRLLDSGYGVRVLIGEDSDCTAVDAFRQALAPRRSIEADRLSIEPAASLHDLMLQIDGTDVVIATRYHNVVASLLMERPIVSIGYSKKNQELLESFGLGRYCHMADEFDVEAVMADLGHIIKNWGALQPRVRCENARRRRLVDEQFGSVLRSFFRDSSRSSIISPLPIECDSRRDAIAGSARGPL
jgi:polysaccharide pyruvyl transferase WcaK-like protein